MTTERDIGSGDRPTSDPSNPKCSSGNSDPLDEEQETARRVLQSFSLKDAATAAYTLEKQQIQQQKPQTQSTGAEAPTKTEQTLQLLMQRIDQQQATIQKLEKTVLSHHETLQEILLTMKSGFAALLEAGTTIRSEGAVVCDTRTLEAIPEKDHPSVLLVNSTHTCTTTSSEGQSTSVASDASIVIEQLPSPHKTDLKREHTHTPRMPSRRPTEDSVSTASGSFFGASQQQLQIKGPSSRYEKKRTTSLLGLENGNDNDNTNDIDSIVTPDHLQHGTASFSGAKHDTDPILGAVTSHSASSGSCRQSIAKDSGHSSHQSERHLVRDKIPLPPNYIPSPITKKGASRIIPSRLARATSAPILKVFASSNGRTKGHNFDMPRLPTREDSDSEGMDAMSRFGSSSVVSDDFDAATVTTVSERDTVEEQLLIAKVLNTEKSNETSSNDDTVLPPSPPLTTAPGGVVSSDKVVEDDGTSTLENSDIPSSQRPSLQATLSSSSSLSVNKWSKDKPSSQHSSSVEATTAVAVVGLPLSQKGPVRSKFTRSFGSKRELIPRQGLAQMNMSCLTLDSALIDEVPEDWLSGDDDSGRCWDDRRNLDDMNVSWA